MPLYQQIFQVLPKFPLEGLVSMFKKHSKTILNLGGNVRGIENHGLRPLPERTRRLFFLVFLCFLSRYNFLCCLLKYAENMPQPKEADIFGKPDTYQ
jgi:hypothetical protein